MRPIRNRMLFPLALAALTMAHPSAAGPETSPPPPQEAAKSAATPTPAPAVTNLWIDLDPGFPSGAQARALIQSGHADKAVELLRTLKTTGEQDTYRRIMLATALREAGFSSIALATLSSLEPPPLIADHVLAFRASLQLEQNDPSGSVETLRKIAPDSPVYPSACLTLAQAELALGHAFEAFQALEPLISGRELATLRPEVLLAAGLTLEMLGMREGLSEAARFLDAVLVSAPMSQEAATAQQALERLKDHGILAPARSIDQSLAHARAYLEANANAEAAPRLEALLSRRDLPDGLRCEVLIDLGASLQNLRRNGDALKPLLDASSLCTGEPQARALFRLEKAYIALGRLTDAERTLRTLMTRMPQHRFNDDGLYALANAYHAKSRLTEARSLFEELIRMFPDGDMRGEATWRLAWTARKENRLEEAITRLDAFIHFARSAAENDSAQASSASSTGSPALRNTLDVDRERYWLALWQASLPSATPGALAQALEALFLEAPESYYGLLAYSRLLNLDRARAEALRGALLEQLRQPPALRIVEVPTLSETVQRAVLLLRVGLRRQAALELLPLVQEATAHEDLLLSYLLEQAGEVSRSHKIVRKLLEHRGEIHLSRDTVPVYQLGYPRAFAQQMEAAAALSEIDPFLLLAVAREESTFVPDIRSYAGAIGLVQLMPATAREEASRMGRTAPSLKDLENPQINLELGAHYLKGLLQRYRGHVGAAVPAYNAGEGTVDRWLKANPDKPFDEFTEEIPYRETREYVKHVLESYQVCRLLYGPGDVVTVSLQLPPGR